MGIIAERWQGSEGVQLDVQRATGLRRFTGLIGRELPKRGCALLIPRCGSVHSFGMRGAIDVVFLSRDLEVLAIDRLAPWRLAASPTGDCVLELRLGEAERLGICPGSKFNETKETEVNDEDAQTTA